MVKVGDKCWEKDENCRHYKNDDGSPRTSPNPRHYWKEKIVIAENRASWFIGSDYDWNNGNPNEDSIRRANKVDKKTLKGRSNGWRAPEYLWSEKEVEDWLWLQENKHPLAEWIRHKVTDIDLLKEIARLTGYEK